MWGTPSEKEASSGSTEPGKCPRILFIEAGVLLLEFLDIRGV
jgi:hypothetical protein